MAASNRVFLTLATVLGFSLIMGLAVLVVVVRTADEMPTPTRAVIVLDAPTSTPAPGTPTATLQAEPSLTPSPQSPTVTPTMLAPAPCAYMWAHQDLPEITATTQDSLKTAGIAQTTVRVEAYGENCIDGQTGTVRSFGAMTTDFYFTVEVDDLANEVSLAAFIKPLYNLAAAIPRDEIPAPPGYFDVTFTAATGALRLRTRFDEAQTAIDRDLKGVALLDALGGLTSISG